MRRGKERRAPALSFEKASYMPRFLLKDLRSHRGSPEDKIPKRSAQLETSRSAFCWR